MNMCISEVMMRQYTDAKIFSSCESLKQYPAIDGDANYRIVPWQEVIERVNKVRKRQKVDEGSLIRRAA